MDQAIEGAEQLHRVKRGRPAKVAAIELPDASPAQAYALRVWNGQSPDVAVIDRVARIANALKQQGMGLDVELPHPDAGRYLDAHK